MTDKEKQLLLVDLCGRLPYGVMCYGVTWNMDEDDNYISKGVTDTLYEIHNYKCCYGLVGLMNECNIETIKPYLRPMSSMTEEEVKEYNRTLIPLDYYDGNTFETFDWLNKNHFDYRGLIEKGLALEASEGMYGKEV